MGEVFVEGLGLVELQGSTPNEAEKQAIISALRKRNMAPPAPVPQPMTTGLGEQGPLASQPSRGLVTPEGLRQALPKVVEPAMVGAAATAGGALGAPAGPAGMAAGAMLGAAGGELAFQQLNDLLRATGVEPLPGAIPEGPQNERVLAGAQRAGGEALLEAATIGLVPFTFAVKGFLTPLFGRIMGTRTDAARQMARLAEIQGVQLGAVDVGGVAPKGMAKTLGVFPFTGTPLRREEARKVAQLGENVNRTLNQLAPTATTAGTIGMDMFKAAQNVSSEFTRISAKLYDSFRTSARNITDLNGNPVAAIPTDETRATITRFVDDFRLGEIPLTAADSGQVQILTAPQTEQFESFLKAAENLPPRLTIDQWARLEDLFESFVDTLSPDGFTVKRVAEIKAALEADLNNILKGMEGQVDPEMIANILRQKQEADTFWATGMALFQSPTGQKLARVDRRLFRPGPPRPGSLNSDELFKPVFSANSAESLRDLRKIVGRETFNRGVRRHFEDVVAQSTVTRRVGGQDIEVFDVDKLAKNLGLVEGLKDRTAALEEMLKGTGVTVGDLKDLVENVRIMEINDPSQFVMRRIILGGAGAAGAVGGAGVAAGLPGGAGAAVAVTLLTRGLSKAIATPGALKKMTRVFSPDLAFDQRRALMVRFARELGIQGFGGERPVAPGPAARIQ